MSIANAIKNTLGSQSMIRKMFEEGIRLKKQHGEKRVFDFSLGNPDLDPPRAFHDTLLALVSEDAAGSHGYMPNAGYPDVRAAMAEKASSEQGVSLDASCVIMSVGAAGGLNTVLKTLLDSGDEVIAPRPYFMEYRAYSANHGGRLITVASGADFSLDLSAIKAVLSPATAAVLINSPHNPTGRVYPAADIAALARLLEEHGAKVGRKPVLIADEPYRSLVYDGLSVPPVLAAYSQSIAVSSFSKSLSLPGERIGYIAVNPAIDERETVMAGLTYCTRVLGYINAPALMQRAVARLTGAGPDLATYARRREAFMAVLDAAGIQYVKPEGAFYIFAKVPPRTRGEEAAAAQKAHQDVEFVEHLKKHLILGVPGSGFGEGGWLRFAYCVNEEHIAASGEAFKRAMEAW